MRLYEIPERMCVDRGEKRLNNPRGIPMFRVSEIRKNQQRLLRRSVQQCRRKIRRVWCLGDKGCNYWQ